MGIYSHTALHLYYRQLFGSAPLSHTNPPEGLLRHTEATHLADTHRHSFSSKEVDYQ